MDGIFLVWMNTFQSDGQYDLISESGVELRGGRIMF